MKKAWEWFKRNWKWFIAPLWIASLVVMWLFRGGSSKPPISGTTDVAADEAMKAKDEAMTQFRSRLDELLKKAQDRLQAASKEQLEEFNELKDKPLDDVAKWIDTIS